MGARKKHEKAVGNAERKGGKLAKKDFCFQYRGKKYDLKKGDDVSDVPKVLHENLKTEGVI